MKKVLSFAILTAIFAFTAFAVTPALAQVGTGTGLETGIEYGTITKLGTKDLRVAIMDVVNAILGFLGILAVIIILWGGFRWLTSGGNEEKVGEAKKIITAGIIGLVIIFTAYAIASFVVGQLLDATGAGGV